MRIVIDGDGSPVKKDVIALAADFHVPVLIVTSIDHFTRQDHPDFVSFVYVDRGSDAADYKIVALVQPQDILITQDYGLASLVLGKGVRVLHHLGKEYTAENIDLLLEQRYHSGKLRKAGIRTKGPSAFTAADRQNFRQQLRKILAMKS